jgi:predicted flap endonuclease-1-like 5' DNA nuclease/predicted nuclease with TOPRIM domain
MGLVAGGAKLAADAIEAHAEKAEQEKAEAAPTGPTAAELTAQLDELKKHYAALQSDLQTESKSKADLAAALQTNFTEIAGLNDKLRAVDAGLDELVTGDAQGPKPVDALAKLVVVKGIVSRLNSDKADLEGDLNTLQTDLNKANGEIANVSAAVDALIDPVPEGTPAPTDLAARFALLSKNIETTRGAKAELETKLQASDAELAGIKAQLTGASTELDALVDGQADAELPAKLIAVKASYEGLVKARTDLEAQVQAKDKEIARLTSELSGAQDQLKTASAAKDDLETQLKAASAAKDDLETQLKAASAAKDDLESQLKVLNAQVADLQRSDTGGSPIGKAVVAGAATIGAATVAKKIGQSGDEKGEVAQAAASDAQGAPQAAGIAAAGAAAAGAAAAGAAAAGAVTGAATADADLTAEVQAKDAEIADLKARLEATTTVLQARDTEYGVAKEKLEAASGRESELAGLQTKYGELQAQFDEVAAANTKLPTLRQDMDALTAKLDTARADLDAATAAKAQLAESLQQRDAELNGLRAEMQRARDVGDKSVAAKAAEIAVLTASAATVAAAMRKKDEELAAAQQKIAELEQQLSDAQARAQTVPVVAAGAVAGAAAAQTTLKAEPASAAPSTGTLVVDKSAAVEAARTGGNEPTMTACPQDLSEVKGIGSVFEQRLYAAGVGTYWELVNLSNDEFVRILQLNERQMLRMDFDDIRGDAQRLAHETGSVGRIWEAKEPDDFEPLEGIGRLYEKKLYDAGICTFEALASTSVDRLQEICPGTKLRTPDYADWITQARRLAAAKP